MLRSVWAGYDLLMKEVLEDIDWNLAVEDLERQITQLLEPRIRESFSGYEPYDCQHGTYESETRKPSPAQPPEYDIAFVLKGNSRLKWPIEAKYIPTAQSCAAYIEDMRKNFLTGRYGPFTGEGAMVAYLRKGTAKDFFNRIKEGVPCELSIHSNFRSRPHRCSSHIRSTPEESQWIREFTCHHLVMSLTNATETK